MSGINNNNHSLHLNSRRLIQATPTKEIVEKVLNNDNNTQISPSLTNENDGELISWLALDQHLLLDMKNIKIISTVKTTPAINADSTQSAGGAKGSSSTDNSESVVSADGTQSAGGAGTSGMGGTSDVVSTNGTNEVVQADGTSSVSGTGGVSGTTSDNTTNSTNGNVQADETSSVSGSDSVGGSTSDNNTKATEELKNFETKISNGEFDRISYNTEECAEYIDTYADLIKADLKSRFNYSDAYIQSMLETAKEYALINRNDNTIEELLTTFKSGIEQLQNTPNLVHNNNRNENLWTVYGMNTDEIAEYIRNQSESSNDIGVKHFTKLFTDIFEKLNLDQEEQDAFVKIVFNEITNITKSVRYRLRDLAFTISDLEILDINNKGSFLDELHSIINEKAKDIGHVEEEEYDTVTSINYDELFKSDNINAEYILENLDNMLLSKDPSIRKFANMISDALKRNGCITKKEKQNYIKWLLVLINEQNGIQHPKKEGILFVGQIDCPVIFADGTSTTITIQITPEDNIRALTQEDAERYIKDNIEEFIEKWAEENQKEIVSHHSRPQMDINPAPNEDTVNGLKSYWAGSFQMKVTLENGTSQYITIPITVNDKIVAGNKYGVENYIKENINEYLSRWEAANINQFITSWDDLNCDAMFQGQVYEYTKDKLKEVGLTDWEIAVYFQKLNDGTYIMQTEKIDKEFPNMNIRDLDYLKSVLNYTNPTVDNIYLTKNELSELGDDALDKIEEILHSQKLNNCYNADVDGVIEKFNQGSNGTGDCWLLSGIAAINATEDGKALFKNSVRWNSDYTAITVTFPGTNDTTEITVEELLNADPDLGSGKYNYGDNDVLAIVLAYEKLFGDIKGDYGDTFFKKFLPFLDRHIETSGKFEGKGLDDLVNIVGGLFGGGGGRVDLSKDTVYEYLLDILKAKDNGQNVAATFSVFTGGDTTYRWTTVDGQEGFANIDQGGWADWGGHVFAITDVTTTTVTFVNPWDSSMSYTVTWNEFANIGIGDISWATWGNHAPVTG